MAKSRQSKLTVTEKPIMSDTPVETVAETIETEAVQETVEAAVEATVEATQEAPATEPVVEAPQAPVVTTEPEIGSPSTVRLNRPVETTAARQESPFVTGIRQRLSSYVENMSGNVPQNALTGGAHQRALLNILMSTLGKDDVEESKRAMAVVLEMFDQYRGNCFNETLAFRFLNSNSLSSDQSKTLRMLLSVLISTSNPNNRGVAIRNVDWRKLTEQFADERYKLNLMSFYFPQQ